MGIIFTYKTKMCFFFYTKVKFLVYLLSKRAFLSGLLSRTLDDTEILKINENIASLM